jgi:hypothetical protein
MVFMLLGDVLSTRYFVESVQKYGPSVHIMFAFEVRTLQFLWRCECESMSHNDGCHGRVFCASAACVLCPCVLCLCVRRVNVCCGMCCVFIVCCHTSVRLSQAAVAALSVIMMAVRYVIHIIDIRIEGRWVNKVCTRDPQL